MKKPFISFTVSALAMLVFMIVFAIPVSAADEKPLTDEDVTAESMYVHTGNTEADAVFNAYVDTAVKLIPLGTDKYGDDYYGSDTRFLATFVKACDGTEEQRDILLNRSHMERYLWTNCYATLASYMLNHPEYFENWETFKYYVVDDSTLQLQLKTLKADEETVEEQMTAYENIMRFQYDYYTEHFTVYCFFTGQDYSILGDNDYSSYFGDAEPVVTDASEQPSGDSDTTTQTRFVESSAATTVTTTQTGIWYNVGETLKGMWFSIGIIAVFLIAFVVVVIVKRKKGL